MYLWETEKIPQKELYSNINNSYKPGCGRPRGGEFAADDCWLDEYHEDNIVRPSYGGFAGDVVPEVFWGDPTAE